MIYGATGYTGRLIAEDAKQQGLAPILAGRSEEVATLAAKLGLALASCFRCRTWRRHGALSTASSIVAHCAGPFAATSAPMIDACLLARTHYVDITGEIDVFVAAQRRHNQASGRRHRRLPGRRLRRHPDRLRCRVPDGGPARRDAPRAGLQGYRQPQPRNRANVDRWRAARRAHPQERRDRHRTARRAARERSTSAPGQSLPCRFRGAMSRRPISRRASRTSRSTFRRRRAPLPECAVSIACGRCSACRPSAPWWVGIAARNNPGPSRKERDSERTWVWGEARNDSGDVRTARLTTTQWLPPHDRRRPHGGARAARASAGRRLFHAVAASRRTMRRAAPRLQRDPNRLSAPRFGSDC